jgi:hypothetical protein
VAEAHSTQQTAQVVVACLGDAQLWVGVARLTSLRSQAQVAAYVTTISEPFFGSEGQDEVSAVSSPTPYTRVSACDSG